MKINCNLEMKGVPIEDSIHRLSNAINNAIDSESLLKHQTELENKLYTYLKENASRANVPIDIEDTFSLETIGNELIINNSNPYLVNKYEYGYDDENDIIPPSYYIRPSIEKFSEDLKNTIRNEVSRRYNTSSSSYVNKIWKY